MSATEALRRFVPAVEAEGIGVYGVEIRVGDDRASHRWRRDDRENLFSLSKGVAVLAVGMAVDEGILTLSTTVGESFPGFDLGDGVAEITLRELLTMTSGIDFLWFGHEPAPWPDLAAEMLRRPSRGRVTQCSDASTYVAMRILSARVGDVRDWLVPRLFEPLGIDNPQWLRCPLGHILGGTGLLLRTSEIARIGDVGRPWPRRVAARGTLRAVRRHPSGCRGHHHRARGTAGEPALGTGGRGHDSVDMIPA